MNATTLLKRIEKHLYTQKGTLAVKYEEVLNLITHPTLVVRPCKWYHYGKSLKDKRGSILSGLTALGIDYVYHNDAPKGGMEGYYIKLSEKGRRQVREFAKMYDAKHIQLEGYKLVIKKS